MKILPLYQCPDQLTAVADLLAEEFGTPLGDHFYEELLGHSMSPGQLPLTLVAMENGVMLGTVGLWRADMLARQDLTPWLACLAVRKDQRGRRIGQALQEMVKETARQMGFNRVYLYTNLKGYYEKTGWQWIDRGYEMDNSEQQIYRFDL